MGTSLSATAHTNDMRTFVKHSNQLAKVALGVELDPEMNKYILETANFLPMGPQANRDAVERHTFKRKLGAGFITIRARRNDMPGGPAYMIRFTVYADEHWSKQ